MSAIKAADKRYQPVVRLAPIKLSDGSTDYNVIVKTLGTTVVFACLGRDHAVELVKQMQDCAWIEPA